MSCVVGVTSIVVVRVVRVRGYVTVVLTGVEYTVRGWVTTTVVGCATTTGSGASATVTIRVTPQLANTIGTASRKMDVCFISKIKYSKFHLLFTQ